MIEMFRGRPPEGFPNRLCEQASPGAARARPSVAVLGALLLVCLLPRLWVAWQQETICPDAVQYLDIAEALRHGDYAEGFKYLSLNIYPAILGVLLQAGTHWVAACEAWSLLMATLAVLPLFGLVRRQFDERVAILACLLYALHPRLIVYSPLILRDPTFWFLFLLSLYFEWRAVTELRWWLFLAAGGAVFLTIHTRSEGWLLLIPLPIWALRRLWIVPAWKKRLIVGVPACIAVIPLATALVNVTLLRNQSQWQMASTRHFAYAWQWLRGTNYADSGAAASGAPDGGSAAQAPEATGPAPESPGGKTVQRLIVRFIKTFTYVYGLVILAGVWSLRRNLLRTDTLPFFFITTALLSGIWIRSNVLPIDERYFFPIVLVSLPGLALGVVQVTEWIVWLGAGLRRGLSQFSRSRGLSQFSRSENGTVPLQDARHTAHRPAVVLALLAVVAVGSAIDGARTGRAMFRAWRAQADLGKWILRQQGPQQSVAGNNEEMRLLAYYAEGYLLPLPAAKLCGTVPVPDSTSLPGVVVLWEDRRPGASDTCKAIVERSGGVGYRHVAADDLPPSCRDLAVLVYTEQRTERVAAMPLPPGR